MHLGQIKATLSSYFEPLANYHFDFFNPFFWLTVVFIFLLFLKFWELKKSFFFSLFLTFMLLTTTEIENRLIMFFASAGESFDTAVIKLISISIVSFFYLMYVFIV